jgi:hypothetical protein
MKFSSRKRKKRMAVQKKVDPNGVNIANKKSTTTRRKTTMTPTEKTVKAAVKKQVDKINPTRLAVENRIDRLIIGFLVGILIIFCFIFGMFIYNNNKESKRMYDSHYYIYSEVSNKTATTTAERKKKFQMKVVGMMKELRSNLSDKEMMNYTSFVFDKSEEYGWDPYLAVSFAWTESRFNKNTVGTSDDRGLYQFLPSTARLVAGEDYYRGIEFNVLDSTKLWFKYMKNLIDYFDGELEYALLAYNMGERGVVVRSGLKKRNNRWYFSTGDLDKVRQFYYNKGYKLSYDEKIIRLMEFARVYGTNNEIPIEKIYKLEETTEGEENVD